jgi:predicted NUDIX family NTP pyrophosphohydrolase
MAKQSAGLLMYRRRNGLIEVFLVHPGGPFWAKKDFGSWSVPKGEFAQDEDALGAARREFLEETGCRELEGELIPLAPIRQPSGKLIHVWAFEGECDAGAVKSNTFSIEWPPGSGKLEEFPEVDRAGWFTFQAAKEKIIRGQAGFIKEFERIISRRLQT